MRCSDVRKLLPPYADEALSAAEQQQITAHLEGCPACAGELDALDRALSALNAAAPSAAPDLWSPSRARLAQEQAQADCPRVESLLPAYAEDTLEADDRAFVGAHLTGCGACAREHAGYTHSLHALRDACPRTAPDLWPALAARLGAELPCARARDLVLLRGEVPGPEESALALHLKTCAPCAAHAETFRQALAALDRTGARLPQVDLWPAFVARLAQQQAKNPAAALAAFWERLWRQPAFRPALGLAALTLFGITAAALLPDSRPAGTRAARPAAQPGPVIAKAPAVDRDEPVILETARRPEKPAPAPHRKPVRRPGPKQPRPVKPRAPRSGGPVIPRRPVMAKAAPPAPQPEYRQPSAEEIRMALAAPPAAPEMMPVTVDSTPEPEARQEMVAEVVHAFELLAGAEDAAKQPFGAESSANAH